MSATDIQNLASSWRTSLEAKNRARNTIDSYLLSVRRLSEFLGANEMPTDAACIERAHVEAFIAHELAVWKPNTAGVRYRSLQAVLPGGLVAEDEIGALP